MTEMSQDRSGHRYPAFRYGATHVVAYTDSSAAMSDPISEDCRLVLVWASTDCHIAIGDDPTATTNDKPITAKVDTPVAVRPGEKIAAIRQSDNGNLYVTELL